jgi:outer membrane biosynthesis protein TonB
MRIGGFFSFLAHGVIIATGVLAAPSGRSVGAEAMPFIDIDLVTIADETNIAPVTKDAELDEKAEEEQQEEFSSATPPPPKPEETVPLDEPEARPPPKPKEKTLQEELNNILGEIPEEKPQPKRTGGNKSANLDEVPDAGARPGAGRHTANTATVRDYISAQLKGNKCWADPDDMPDAHRLRAVFSVRFGRNGRFLEAPKMIEPSRPPSSDPPLEVYIQRARRALDMCNSIGFRVPNEYFQDQPVQYIELVFLP